MPLFPLHLLFLPSYSTPSTSRVSILLSPIYAAKAGAAVSSSAPTAEKTAGTAASTASSPSFQTPATAAPRPAQASAAASPVRPPGLSTRARPGRAGLLGVGDAARAAASSHLNPSQLAPNSERNMVEGLPAELPIVDVAARLDGKSSELPENGALLKGAEESQDLGGNPVAELTLHEGKEVILVDDNDSEQEDGGCGKVDENAPRDFLRSSFVTDESNMIQGAPSASHLESPHLGVDLMAQADSQGYGNQWAFPTLQIP
uniref:Protein FAR1-RELATED SEQUENCE n=1 Tax=Oryza glumipatula TaxID=40148 RepID=A0A0D9YUR4_9ORYZ